MMVEKGEGEGEGAKDRVRAGEHSDFGMLTLLLFGGW